MKYFAFVLVLSVVGLTLAQEDVGQQLRETISVTDALTSVSEENGCRQIVVDLLAGCSVEIYPNTEFGTLLETLVNIADDGTFTLRSGDLSTELTAVSQDSARTLSAAGCCSFACELARNGCGCDEGNYNALLEFFGDSATSLLQQIRDICAADNPTLTFEVIVFGTPQCTTDFETTTSAFVCS